MRQCHEISKALIICFESLMPGLNLMLQAGRVASVQLSAAVKYRIILSIYFIRFPGDRL